MLEGTTCLVLALLLGLLLIFISREGAGEHRTLTVATLVVGVGAALLPVRRGLPIALSLATFSGLLLDFAASPAAYWNEVFVASVVARSLLARPPSSGEFVGVAVPAAVYAVYLASGTSATAVLWGAKVLLTSLVLMWALGRMKLERGSWDLAYVGLAIGVGANVVLASWQHQQGAAGLRELGIHRGRLEEGAHGLRVFGGFGSPAAFSFALAIALLLWFAWATGGHASRRAAAATAWIVPACGIGLVWAEHRTTFVAFVVAAAAGVLRELRGARLAAGTLAIAVILTAVLVAGGSSYRHALAQAFTADSSEARTRIGGWRGYLGEFTPGGNGPAASGSAYLRVHGPTARPLPLAFGVGRWGQQFTRTGVPFRWLSAPATIFVQAPTPQRPAATLVADVTSYRIARRVAVRSAGRRLALVTVPADRFVRLRVPVPVGRGTAKLELVTRPPARATRGELKDVDGAVAVQFRAARVAGFPLAPTAAERVKERIGLSAPAGVVDNQYVSWVFEYGLLGGFLCLMWVVLFVAPIVVRLPAGAVTRAGRMIGVFVVVSALGVNAWEETPTDFLAAVFAAPVVAVALRAGGRTRLWRHAR